MYEVFRANTLRYLGDLDRETLEKIANAMDMSYREVPFDSQESDDRQSDAYEFASIIDSYVTARKMEGLSDGTTMHMERILKSFMSKTSKPIRSIKTYDIRGYISSYQSERNISNRSLDFIRTIICTFFKWCAAEGYLDSNPAANVRPDTFATQAITGAGVEIVQQMLGHANISTTMIYAEIDMNEVKAAHVRSVV